MKASITNQIGTYIIHEEVLANMMQVYHNGMLW